VNEEYWQGETKTWSDGERIYISRLEPAWKKEAMDYWRLCDELSVIQAAALCVGIDPSDERGSRCDGWAAHEQPLGYAAAKAALTHAINAGRLPATVRHDSREYGWADVRADIEAGDADSMTVRGYTLDHDERLSADDRFIYHVSPDWALTTVRVEDLRKWLSERGFRTGFFFPDAPNAPDYLDPNHPRYAPKLAAAVRAWMAVDVVVAGKTAKQLLEKWLRENSAAYGLSDDDGKQNETGINQCAGVANWQPGGGAPKTPGT
jgi:hypothetical protein